MLENAKALIAKGFIQGSYSWYNSCTGGYHYCTLGALREVQDGHGSISIKLTYDLLRAALPTEFQGRGLVNYNDCPLTTQDDVLNLFDKAIRDARTLAEA